MVAFGDRATVNFSPCLICTRSEKQHVVIMVMRAEFTTFTFSESVGNGTEVLIKKLLRFLYSDATCN